MSDYDAEYERQRQIDEEYVRTLNEYNRAVDYHNRLVVDVARAQEDVFSGINVVAPSRKYGGEHGQGAGRR